ncbi:MAG: hypothetical protein JRF25_03895, partial [Deltaproteobacteria bacterium]|nr:hypothetical protein [Deltaproteobacteria bacterium]
RIIKKITATAPVGTNKIKPTIVPNQAIFCSPASHDLTIAKIPITTAAAERQKAIIKTPITASCVPSKDFPTHDRISAQAERIAVNKDSLASKIDI